MAADPRGSCSAALVSRLLVVLGILLLLVGANGVRPPPTPVTTSPQSGNPPDRTLRFNLSDQPALELPVMPLTDSLGLGGSDRTLQAIKIVGLLKLANASTYKQISGRNNVAYLSCDAAPTPSPVDANTMLNSLMTQSLGAIVLYSTAQGWCSIDQNQDLPYSSILTMATSEDAVTALRSLNASAPTGPPANLSVQISGNRTADTDSSSDSGTGSNSAVAMSILYSITGLITLLFLVIIATGAIRAHRYPERYGPRGALGGRPRQSRAKGLARAVLETLPIVKFGDHEEPSHAKPDPELDLDSTVSARREPAARHGAPPPPPSPTPQDHPAEVSPPGMAPDSRRPSQEVPLPSPAPAPASAEPPRGSRLSTDPAPSPDAHLGCSICTEDFKVGEDVRVLPCNHQYHPSCVDPWLVNVSGTCPLCRLDLRPRKEQQDGGASTDGGDDDLAPPLALDHDDASPAPAPQARRLSRLPDIHRLRQATPQERLEALRQMRAHAQLHDPPGSARDGGSRSHAARLTSKLKDKFRILTRAQQPAEHQEGS